MVIRILTVLFLCVGVQTLSAQVRQVKVTITDENTVPLNDAYVKLGKYVLLHSSDSLGTYIFKNLTPGNYNLLVSAPGYQTVDTQVVLSNKNFVLPITLKPEINQLEEVVVISNTIDQKKRVEQLNVEIVRRDFIQKNLGGSLMKSLERIPGVQTIDIGSGQSKPLIRGMGFNRVAVIDKGVKHEGQQWGADHGLEIDQFDTDEVEIIKGTASFAYGSDAITGAIVIKPSKIPMPHTFGGDINLIGKTNNGLYGTSVNLYGRNEKWFASGRVTLQKYGDYRVSADRLFVYDYPVDLYKNHLRNTAGQEFNQHVSFGFFGNQVQSVFYFDNNFNKSGFFANAHGLEPRKVDAELHDKSSRDILNPYQQVNHFKVINQTRIDFDNHSLEMRLGYQNNLRKEYNQYVNHGYMPPIYPDAMDIPIDLERYFNKDVYSFNVKNVFSMGDHDFQFGVNTEIQDNAISGWSFLVPSFRQKSFGIFAYDKLHLNERTLLHGAIRYDYSVLDIHSYRDWFPTPIEQNGTTENSYVTRADQSKRYFGSLTGSIGVNYNVQNLSLKANVGKSFRVPIAKELAANGVNYHYFSYEKGNIDLDPEESYQVDATARYGKGKWNVLISPFYNYFPNYIYLNPTPDHDYMYGAGNQVFEYQQSRVMRYGGELEVNYQILPTLSTGVLAEYLYAKQLSGKKKGYTLPFSPPPSVLLNLSYEPVKTGVSKQTYFSVDYRITAAQKKIVPPERKTDRYALMNIQMGTRLKFHNQPVQVNLQVQNVFNKRYMIHTSFYRLIGLPEQGRNIVISLKIPLNIKKSE